MFFTLVTLLVSMFTCGFWHDQDMADRRVPLSIHPDPVFWKRLKASVPGVGTDNVTLSPVIVWNHR